MRTWVRSAIRRECGRCAHVIAVSDPALRIAFTNATTVIWRCVGCAGPAPDDLAPDPKAAMDTAALKERIAKLVRLTAGADWKQSQGNDR